MPTTWKIELTSPGDGEPFASGLDGLFDVVRVTVDEAARAARVEAYVNTEPDASEVTAALREVAGGVPVPPFDIVALPNIDWLAESQKSFAPIRVGSFLVHDGDHRPPGPRRLKSRRPVAIEIAASIAFGTGSHATTSGCLLALDRLSRRRTLRPGPVLDLGCGTGILTIAAVKLLRRSVIAADIDPIAVATARDNIRRAGVARAVRVLRSAGFDNAALRAAGPYGLILANILARPLNAMAADLARHLRPGGWTVLSGLLESQERQVLGPHIGARLRLEGRIVRDGWTTLLLSK